MQSLIGLSQFSDEFSDGDFTTNPAWFGNIASFEVDTILKLHLNDSIANTSYLTTQSQAIINASWEFEIKLDFDPSTSNYAKVYLVADQANLTDNLNGYFIMQLNMRIFITSILSMKIAITMLPEVLMLHLIMI